MTLRLLHFSDPHLEAGLRGAPAGAFANKRVLGFANLVMRRRRHFDGADTKVQALAPFADANDVDFVLCTGDYTALGTVAELESARRAIAPLVRAPRGFATVPGNHDVYVADAPGAFDRIFSDGLASDLEGYQWPRGGPFVRLVGDHAAIVGIDSAHANPLHRSSGRVARVQLDALACAIAEPRLAGRFVLVALHYAPLLWNGRPDSALHGLDNHAELLEVIRGLAFGALVFGHVHHGYVVRVPGLRAPLVCAGSATYAARESAWLWELDAGHARATRLGWNAGRWEAAGVPELELRPR